MTEESPNFNLYLNINRCFMRFQDRAERIDMKQIADTFVSVGPLLDVLESSNNQIMYGRRGTGKTHALKYFSALRRGKGDLALYVDCQAVGSNQSIYEDKELPVSERATRLLIDVCSAMHWDLLDIFSEPSAEWDWSQIMPLLDRFTTAISEVRVSGTTQIESTLKEGRSDKSETSLGIAVSSSPSVNVGMKFEDASSDSLETRQRREGVERAAIDFNYFTQCIRAIAEFVYPKRIWLLIDEWSTVPQDIQPYLADLLRRSMFSVANITVKLAAIEHRSVFKLDTEAGGYIGFELGADISPAINLDDYLVFDNNADRAEHFFRHL